MSINWPKVADVAERTLATFGQAFLGVVIVSGVSQLTALEAAGVAGGLAAAKYLYVQLNLYLHPSDE